MDFSIAILKSHIAKTKKKSHTEKHTIKEKLNEVQKAELEPLTWAHRRSNAAVPLSPNPGGDDTVVFFPREKNASRTNGNPKRGTRKNNPERKTPLKILEAPPFRGIQPHPGSSRSSPRAHLSAPPARRVGRRRPFLRRRHVRVLSAGSVARSRGRGGLSGGCGSPTVTPAWQWYVVSYVRVNTYQLPGSKDSSSSIKYTYIPLCPIEPRRPSCERRRSLRRVFVDSATTCVL